MHKTTTGQMKSALLALTAMTCTTLLATGPCTAQRLSIFEPDRGRPELVADLSGVDAWALLAWAEEDDTARSDTSAYGAIPTSAVLLAAGLEGQTSHVLVLPRLDDAAMGSIHVGLITRAGGGTGLEVETSALAELPRMVTATAPPAPELDFHHIAWDASWWCRASLEVPTTGYRLEHAGNVVEDDGTVTVRMLLHEPPPDSLQATVVERLELSARIGHGPRATVRVEFATIQAEGDRPHWRVLAERTLDAGTGSERRER